MLSFDENAVTQTHATCDLHALSPCTIYLFIYHCTSYIFVEKKDEVEFKLYFIKLKFLLKLSQVEEKVVFYKNKIFT